MVGSQVKFSAAGSRFTYEALRFCSVIVSMRAVQNVVYRKLEESVSIDLLCLLLQGP